MLIAVDSQWMARALQLAELGFYTTSPNPRVGCVLVKNKKNIGEGWHVRAGEPHAEVLALRAAGDKARGATAYVTLEPCGHYGRTPPCADALIAAGVTRVVIAMQDPNPLVAGRGIAKLKSAGIAVACGLMEATARELNIGFVSRMTRGTPWVRSKIAASLDGRTALANGQSKWITGEAARQDVQQWRARSCALMTGIGTVLADDPQLNVRGVDVAAAVRQPLRVVLDSELRISPDAKILQGGNVLIYTAFADAEKQSALRGRGAELSVVQRAEDELDLTTVLRDLAQRGINEVLVEAGKTLNGALLKAGLVDELVLYLAPQLLGDAARGLANLGELTQLDQRVALTWQEVRHVGTDIRITAKVKHV
ncbi:MAG: bifunctional diaminohydroxyphosphoribosylaminopyrimidine deaminase/5-amino-6-(5-phosphoribosylamino)uracil reductase RibD [Gallionella sp.]|nr:bifunctional diaminohydroxyphosphoribosylaminopyrimidine deaminase/5-amino-6-(5-phosphoribosylamino)uracil reductase RibD [Gallionella sp.]